MLLFFHPQEEARARELFDKVARDEEAERQRQQAVVAKKLKFKQTLDEQVCAHVLIYNHVGCVCALEFPSWGFKGQHALHRAALH